LAGTPKRTKKRFLKR